MLNYIAILMCGFSVFSALILASNQFKQDFYQLIAVQIKLAGILFLFSLAVLQLIHFLYLQAGINLIQSPLYNSTLFVVAPLFYLFSKPLLTAQYVFSNKHWIHLVPALIAYFLPTKPAAPLAFLLGAFYLTWLGYRVYALRAQRHHFQQELGFLALLSVTGLLVAVLGISLPIMSETLFINLYAIAIGSAFILMTFTLNNSPQLAEKISTAAQSTYRISTLKNLNIDNTLHKLDKLMNDKKLYQQTDLNLATLATHLEISPHQLSELINTQKGFGFSHYLRKIRIEAAQTMLITEPKASILAISLSVGFTSQSNFYQAFHSLSGMTPGNYRKLKKAKT